MVHVLAVDQTKNTFRLGRGHESDVRVNDISVSRCHAILKYKDDSFFVEDNLSKFGTLVLIKDKLEIE
jgi:pSer/pThr/pTyr-binding forkhead associated (FHA) protein